MQMPFLFSSGMASASCARKCVRHWTVTASEYLRRSWSSSITPIHATNYGGGGHHGSSRDVRTIASEVETVCAEICQSRYGWRVPDPGGAVRVCM